MSEIGKNDNTVEIRAVLDDQLSPGLQKDQEELDKFADMARETLQALGPALDRQTDAISRGIAETFRLVKEESRKAAEEAKKAAEATAKAAAEAAQKQKESWLGVAAVVAGYGVGARLKASVTDWAASGDAMLALSAKTGIAAEELTALAYAARMNDIPMEQMSRSLAFLSRAMVSAENGSGAAAAAFEQLGVKIEGSDGKLKKPIQVFFDAAEAMGDVTDQAKLAALSMQLFGRSGDELLPMLNNIGKIKAQMGEATRLGLVQTEEQLKSAARMDEAVTRLEATWGKLKGSVVGGLAETFSPALSTVQALTASLGDMGETAKTATTAVGSMVVIAATIAAIAPIATKAKDAIKSLIGSWKNLAQTAGEAAALTVAAMFLAKAQREAGEAAEALQKATEMNVWSHYIRGMAEAGTELRELRHAFDELSRVQGDSEEAWEQLRASQAAAARVLERYPGLLQSIGTNFTSAAAAARAYGNTVDMAMGKEAGQVRQALAAAESDLARIRTGEAWKSMIRANPLTHNPAPEYASIDVRAAAAGPDMRQVGLMDRTSVIAQIAVKEESVKQLRALDRKYSEDQRARLLADERTKREIEAAGASEQENLLKQHTEREAQLDDLASRARTQKAKAEIDKLRKIEDQRYARELSKAGGGSNPGGGSEELARIRLAAERKGQEELLRDWYEYQDTLAEIYRADGATFADMARTKAAVDEAWTRVQAQKQAAALTAGMDESVRVWKESRAAREEALQSETQSQFAAFQEFQSVRDQMAQAEETLTQRVEREHLARLLVAKKAADQGTIEKRRYDDYVVASERMRDRELEDAAREHARRMDEIRAEKVGLAVQSSPRYTDEEKNNLQTMIREMQTIQRIRDEIMNAKSAADADLGIAQLDLEIERLRQISDMPGPDKFRDTVRGLIDDMQTLIALAGDYMAALSSGDSAAAAAALARLAGQVGKTNQAMDKVEGSTKKPQTALQKFGTTAKRVFDEYKGALADSLVAALMGEKSFGQAMKDVLAQILAAKSKEYIVKSLEEIAKALSCLASPKTAAEAPGHFKAAAGWAAAAAACGVAAGVVNSAGGGGGGSGSEEKKSEPRDYTTEDLEAIKAQGNRTSSSSGSSGSAGELTSGSSGSSSTPGGKQGRVIVLHVHNHVYSLDPRDAARVMRKSGAGIAQGLAREFLDHPAVAVKIGALTGGGDL